MTTNTWTVGAREDMLKGLFKQVAPPVVSTYLSMYHPTPDTEISLSRVLVGASAWDIVTVGADVYATNNTVITIDDAAIGTVSGIVIFDAETGGNIVLAQEFDGATTLEIVSDTDVVFNENFININLNHTN